MKNIKTITFTLVLILLTYGIQAQSNNYKSGSLLWKISGKNLSEPSYLLGTFHLKPGEYLDSIPGAKAAFESCKQVIGELTMGDLAGMQSQMGQAILMNPDTTYQMLYSEEDYNFINEKLTSTLGARLDQMATLNPAGIQFILIMMEYQKLLPGINLENTLDIMIQRKATEAQKTIVGLETIDDQIAVLFGSSLARQAEMLLCGLKNMDQLVDELPLILASYDKSDLNQLYQKSLDNDEPCPYSQEEEEALNKKRNDAWMLKLPDLMKEKTSFIAVGALHLAGEEGLLNQLEKSGYKVEAVF